MAAVICYLDTSDLAPLFLPEANSEAVAEFVRALPAGALATSHWTRVEFSSLLARQRRMKIMSLDQTDSAEAMFDRLVAHSFRLFPTLVADQLAAIEMLRRSETALRAPDALHLAIARNRECVKILSLDKSMIREGRLLGIQIGPGIDLEGYGWADL
ncbi:type II toxin-antitoxin system VapC family toxin [Aquibium sp. LZ166]|uniref:Ribonuclease VapC n=1 Tax=Aquibium pacificus TaxID=3153579 RepID=A0ABV3SEA0_9HYPH